MQLDSIRTLCICVVLLVSLSDSIETCSCLSSWERFDGARTKPSRRTLSHGCLWVISMQISNFILCERRTIAYGCSLMPRTAGCSHLLYKIIPWILLSIKWLANYYLLRQQHNERLYSNLWTELMNSKFESISPVHRFEYTLLRLF